MRADGKRYLCANCGERWRQDGLLCRTCALQIGDAKKESRAEILARRMMDFYGRGSYCVVKRVDGRPLRTIKIGHREFDVMWDGT